MVRSLPHQSRGTLVDPGPGRGLNIWVIFFLAKVHSAFHSSGVGKMSTDQHTRTALKRLPEASIYASGPDHCKAPLSI